MAEDTGPPVKKAKQQEQQQQNGIDATTSNGLQKHGKAQSRRLFAPFRALGIVSNATPFAVQTRGGKGSTKTAVNVVTSLGRAWAMWDAAASLNLLFVGMPPPPPANFRIACRIR
jgi:U3 small nucleolar RNA-associated protein 21